MLSLFVSSTIINTTSWEPNGICKYLTIDHWQVVPVKNLRSFTPVKPIFIDWLCFFLGPASLVSQVSPRNFVKNLIFFLEQTLLRFECGGRRINRNTWKDPWSKWKERIDEIENIFRQWLSSPLCLGKGGCWDLCGFCSDHKIFDVKFQLRINPLRRFLRVDQGKGIF